jgi:hypothetical protein
MYRIDGQLPTRTCFPSFSARRRRLGDAFHQKRKVHGSIRFVAVHLLARNQARRWPIISFLRAASSSTRSRNRFTSGGRAVPGEGERHVER